MIDNEIFLQQMALVADRIGRELAGPTQREYHRQLSAALTTQQFVAAMTLVFSTWSAEFRNWPSPAQIIELITPVANPSLSGAEAFERVLAVMHPQKTQPAMIAKIQTLGASSLRAFRAAGGFRDFMAVLESDLPWLRKRFVEAYESSVQNADAERVATLALGDADARVQQLVSQVAEKRAIPAPQLRVAAGGARS